MLFSRLRRHRSKMFLVRKSPIENTVLLLFLRRFLGACTTPGQIFIYREFWLDTGTNQTLRHFQLVKPYQNMTSDWLIVSLFLNPLSSFVDILSSDGVELTYAVFYWKNSLSSLFQLGITAFQLHRVSYSSRSGEAGRRRVVFLKGSFAFEIRPDSMWQTLRFVSDVRQNTAPLCDWLQTVRRCQETIKQTFWLDD